MTNHNSWKDHTMGFGIRLVSLNILLHRLYTAQRYPTKGHMEVDILPVPTDQAVCLQGCTHTREGQFSNLSTSWECLQNLSAQNILQTGHIGHYLYSV